MIDKSKTHIEKNFKERSILVSREFHAPVEKVWRAFSESEILDQWWGPKPWKAETKIMNFSVGGYWLYAMVGPENEKHWGRMDYLAVDTYKSFDLQDAFCDAGGNINTSLPISKGKNKFTETPNGTVVEFTMVYPSEKDLQTLVDMGFEEGISICFDQLESLFQQKVI